MIFTVQKSVFLFFNQLIRVCRSTNGLKSFSVLLRNSFHWITKKFFTNCLDFSFELLSRTVGVGWDGGRLVSEIKTWVISVCFVQHIFYFLFLVKDKKHHTVLMKYNANFIEEKYKSSCFVVVVLQNMMVPKLLW
jgi:hypothetical protein